MTDNYPTPAPVFCDADYNAPIIGHARTAAGALRIYRRHFRGTGTAVLSAEQAQPERPGEGPVDGWIPDVMDAARILIASDHEEGQAFCDWLNTHGHDAAISNDTGNYINGATTTADEHAHETIRRLWDAFCADVTA